MIEDAKAAKQRRLAEALRANLKRRKAAARNDPPGAPSEATSPKEAAAATGDAKG